MSENQNMEYKRSWRDEYLKWICAFANAEGGTLFIGIEDDGTVVGVEDSKRLLEELPNKIASTMGLVCPVDVIDKDGRAVVRITVKPSSAPVSYHGEFHIRSGATKQVLTGPALTQFILEKTGTKWDGLPVDNVTVEELDYESFDIFKRNAVSSRRMSNTDVNVSNKELLDRLGLLSGEKLTRAAVLLFHRHPEKWFPTCYTQIGYFRNDADILFQDEVHGSLLVQAEHAIELLWLKYFIAPITYQGMTRVDNYPYSKDAVRELLYNSLIHQDFVNGGSVQISVYQNRMFISNAGGLPAGWTVDTLMGKHRSEARNDLIAKVFFRAGFVEKWGRGIEKVCLNCREYGNPNPIYSVSPCDVMVRLDAILSAQFICEKEQVFPKQVTLPVNGNTLPVTTSIGGNTLPVGGNTLPVGRNAPSVNQASFMPMSRSPLGRLLIELTSEMGISELMARLNLKNRLDVRERYLHPAMKYGYIEYTIPDKPNSRLQKYRLTALGQQMKETMENGRKNSLP